MGRVGGPVRQRVEHGRAPDVGRASARPPDRRIVPVVAGALLLLVAAVPIAAGSAAARHPDLASPLELRASPGNSSTTAGNNANGSSLNNTSSRLSNAVVSFASWFLRGLEIVIVLVIGILLIGGILNYVLVGRHRGVWNPADAEGLKGRERPPAPAEPPGPPPGAGPP